MRLGTGRAAHEPAIYDGVYTICMYVCVCVFVLRVFAHVNTEFAPQISNDMCARKVRRSTRSGVPR